MQFVIARYFKNQSVPQSYPNEFVIVPQPYFAMGLSPQPDDKRDASCSAEAVENIRIKCQASTHSSVSSFLPKVLLSSGGRGQERVCSSRCAAVGADRSRESASARASVKREN